MVDPLISTLRALQSSANNNKTPLTISWRALNAAGQSVGAPSIDYDRFAARWDSDPILKQLVARFDGHGVVIKTDKKEPKPEKGNPEAHSQIDKMAKRATNAA